MMNGDATFVAPATPFGHSGIAVVRINGPLACQILSILSKQKLADTRYAKLTSLYDAILIIVLLVYFYRATSRSSASQEQRTPI